MNASIINKYRDMRRFVLFVYAHFVADDCTYIASALAFTSLLALVPLMSVGLSILSSLPSMQNLSGPVQDFIFENFVPATGLAIQEYLQRFTAQVSNLSIIGVIFLFITALLLMVTIEGGMNKIWRVKQARRGVSAFLLYWAILSLAPVLLGLSIAATSYLVSMPLIKDYESSSLLLKVLPFFLSLIAFNFLYVVVPNCKVKILYGFYGAIVSACLFEMAKLGFAYYLRQYNTYELLYGAFATIPIFFIWVYWVWLITLLGAEIAYAFSVYYKRRVGADIDGFSHALIWLYQLWKAQEKGEGLHLEQLINACAQPFAIDVEHMVSKLIDCNYIHVTERGQYMLSRDLAHVSLYQLAKSLPYPLPDKKTLEKVNYPALNNCFSVLLEQDEQMAKQLSVKLDALFGASEK